MNKKNTCQLCSKLVNPLEQLCKECKKIGSVSAILTSREIEDWGGLVSKDEKKERKYMQKKIQNKEINPEKYRNILIETRTH